MRTRLLFPAGLALLVASCTYDPKVDPTTLVCKDDNGCPAGYRCIGATGAQAGLCCNHPDAAACLAPTDATLDSGSSSEASPTDSPALAPETVLVAPDVPIAALDSPAPDLSATEYEVPTAPEDACRDAGGGDAGSANGTEDTGPGDGGGPDWADGPETCDLGSVDTAPGIDTAAGPGNSCSSNGGFGRVTTVAGLSLGAWPLTSSPHNGEIYLIGGQVDGSNCTDKGWRYTIATNTMTDLGKVLPFGYCGAATSNVASSWGDNGKLYLTPALGPTIANGWGSHRCMIEFDPSTAKAIEKACFPSTIWNQAIVNGRNGYLYVLGGWNGASRTIIYKYDPVADSIVDTGVKITDSGNSLNTGGTVETSSGKAYFFSDSYGARHLYVFDPAGPTFTDLGSHGTSGPHVAWMGPDGLLYQLAPSSSSSFRILASFDPSTRVVKTTDLGASLFSTRTRAGLSVDLSSGRLYAIGGYVAATSIFVATGERTDCLPGGS